MDEKRRPLLLVSSLLMIVGGIVLLPLSLAFRAPYDIPATYPMQDLGVLISLALHFLLVVLGVCGVVAFARRKGYGFCRIAAAVLLAGGLVNIVFLRGFAVFLLPVLVISTVLCMIAARKSAGKLPGTEGDGTV